MTYFERDGGEIGLDDAVKTCGVGCDARTIGNGDQRVREDTIFVGLIRAGCGAGGGVIVIACKAASESCIAPQFF